jgi:hypothetical protein
MSDNDQLQAEVRILQEFLEDERIALMASPSDRESLFFLRAKEAQLRELEGYLAEAAKRSRDRNKKYKE